MALVAFDANTCIWGVKNQNSPGQANMVGLANNLIKTLTKHSVDILLPSPVISELMSPMPPPAAINFYSQLTRKFQVGYFDAKATLILAEILNHHYITTGKHYKNLGISKTAMKYDAYIIAIAVANNVEAIYSEDPDFISIAAHFVPILKLTSLPPSIIQTGNAPLLGQQIP